MVLIDSPCRINLVAEYSTMHCHFFVPLSWCDINSSSVVAGRDKQAGQEEEVGTIISASIARCEPEESVGLQSSFRRTSWMPWLGTRRRHDHWSFVVFLVSFSGQTNGVPCKREHT